ncbi:MAG: hypothetical protein V3U11_03905 [Planctomycetota bacterium]
MSKIEDSGISKMTYIKKGHTVLLDSGRSAQLGCCSDWDKADFRLFGPDCGLVSGHAVRVEVTGRKVRYLFAAAFTGGSIRVKITFPGDGEPDRHVGGWISANEALRGAGLLNPFVRTCYCPAPCAAY